MRSICSLVSPRMRAETILRSTSGVVSWEEMEMVFCVLCRPRDRSTGLSPRNTLMPPSSEASPSSVEGEEEEEEEEGPEAAAAEGSTGRKNSLGRGSARMAKVQGRSELVSRRSEELTCSK